MDFRAIVAGLLCALALATPARAQGPWPDNCKLVLAAALPFHIESGELVVAVRVNDTPRQFIIDTGGFASDVSEKVVQELNLPRIPIRNVIIKDSGGASATHFTIANSLAIGTELAKNIQLMISNSGFDGTISPDLLRNFDLEIDFPNRVINLFRPHACAGKAVYWTEKFSTVPIDVTQSGHIRVPITLNGHSISALLDTGASLTVLAADVAASRFGVKPQGGPQGKLTGGMGTQTSFTDKPFESMQIGDTVLDKPVIAISNGKGDSFVDGTAIVLGQRELRKFHIYIAYRERKLYISEEDSKPSAAITVSTATMAPAEAIAAAKRAAPTPFAGTFTFQVQSTRRASGQLLLSSETDFQSTANLIVTMPLGEAAKLAADGLPADDYLKGKQITVVGGARIVRVQQVRDGQPVGEPQIQTRIPVTSSTQISVAP